MKRFIYDMLLAMAILIIVMEIGPIDMFETAADYFSFISMTFLIMVLQKINERRKDS